MERKSGTPEPVTIARNERSEVHVQAVFQSGRRHVDVRTFRRRPGGFAPSPNGLTLEPLDLDALLSGVGELLKSSDGGRRSARIVSDHTGGRRLRAEIEPFGTKFAARLGFWQRVRNSWRPLDNGIMLPSEQLQSLVQSLQRFRPWLMVDLEDTRRPRLPQHLDTWPPPAGDWLTIEPDRIALHPRGIHLTAVYHGGDHLEIRQWRREESIWLPDDDSFSVSVDDLEKLLICLSRLPASEGDTIRCTNGPRLLISCSQDRLLIQQIAPDDAVEPRLVVPADDLGKVGRMLAESWTLLSARLAEPIREYLAEPDVVEIQEEHPPLNDVQAEEVPRDVSDPGERLATIPGETGDVDLRLRDGHLWLDSGSQSLPLPTDLLSVLRSLYYEAFKGRRGQSIAVGKLRASFRSQGLQACLVLALDEKPDDERDDTLQLPADSVPLLMDAIEHATVTN
ncbi:MAG: hypothetical protein ACREP2_12260 [Rhodanobacteraceae bacterium]